MGFKNRIKQIGKYLLIARSASRFNLTGHLSNLETSREKLMARLAGSKDTTVNRIQLRYLIGIERWTQKRLKVFVGAEADQNEPEMYMPDGVLKWEALRHEFKIARNETVALVKEIASETMDAQTVSHNQYGDLTLNEWIHFLNIQTNMESRRFE